MTTQPDTILWSDISSDIYNMPASPEHRTGVEVPSDSPVRPPPDPVPEDEWYPDTTELPNDWCGAVRAGILIKTVPGPHVWCKYKFFLLHKHSPLPQLAGRKSICKLAMLERGHVGRPRHSDHTPEGYIQRALGSRPQRRLEDVYAPTHPARFIYTAFEDWILIDFERFPECSNCHKPLKSLSGRSTRVIDNFRFRACCYPAPKFHQLEPKATTAIAEIVTVVYDLETTPNEDGVHELYLGVVSIPDALMETGLFPNRLHIIHTAEEFIYVVDRVIASTSQSHANIKTSIQLVSFNGSRYDDLFLTRAWRNYVYRSGGRESLDALEYSERKGSLTFNTLIVNENLEVRWTDLARFVPPTSLKNLAKSFKLSVEKGSMPFMALNDFVQRGADSVARDDDGFLSLAQYYGGDVEERQASFEYYLQCVPEDKRTPDQDIRIFCEAYCRQDVLVTEQAYQTLERLYRTYLGDLGRSSPYSGEGDSFEPMCLHSLATMAGKIMLASAVGHPSWGYNSVTKEERIGHWALYSPREHIYDFVQKACVGGWVKGYYQGFIVDKTHAPADIVDFIKLLAKRHRAHLEFAEMEMTDIASMYPVAVTYPMPMGAGEWVESQEERDRIIAETVACDDPIMIHKFFVRCKWRAPRSPLFSESTLPQRTNVTNSLRWAYWDDPTGERILTSLDLWIACHKHTDDSDSTWEAYEATEILFFPTSAQVYRPFMEACAKMKTDGANAGNEEQRTIGKIAMNSAIGKLGQSVEARRNVLGDDAATNVVHDSGDRCRLVGFQPVEFDGGARGTIVDTEYVFAVKDASKNRWPTHHSAFMYAATRLMRLHWSLLTRPQGTKPLIDQDLPDTIYGDTDSKLLLKCHSDLMPTELRGSIVGQFQPEEPPSRLTRPFFQVEPEKVSALPTRAVFAMINAPKKYLVYGFNPETRTGVLKLKCNGVIRFDDTKHPCPLHGEMRCGGCKQDCVHAGAVYGFECVRCCLRYLASEDMEMGVGAGGKLSPFARNTTGVVYRYDLMALRSLTLLDFLRVVVTGQSHKVLTNTFVRNLSLPTSKLPSFSVKTDLQSRSLHRPLLLSTPFEIASDRPARKRLGAYVSGCAQLDTSRGVLKPSGTYLIQHV